MMAEAQAAAFLEGKGEMEGKHQELKVKRDRQQQSRGASLGLETSELPPGVRLQGLAAGGTGVISFMKSKTNK